MNLADLNIKPDEKMLRQFGIIALFGFGIIGTIIWIKWNYWSATYIFWGAGIASFLLALIRPRLLLPLFVFLTVITFPIGFVISNIIIILLYYVLFTPIALLFKIIGRDPLSRHFDTEQKTYWMNRNSNKAVSQRFKQY